MNKNDQQFIVQKIRTQYMEKQTTELDELRALDREVKRPANIIAYVLGSIGAIVMGIGMSLVMTDIGSIVGIAKPLISGIIIGAVGMAAAIANYPLYNKILDSRKKKYADRILSLGEKIMNK